MSSSVMTHGRDAAVGRTALLAFLGAESVFFGTLIMVYVYLRTNELSRDAAQFSPALLLPIVNTTVLVISALLVRWANQGIAQGRNRRLQIGLAWGLGLGLLFVAGQVIEFAQAGMLPRDGALAGVYFTLIGFHALHVLAGVIVLGINLVRASLEDFSAERHVAVDLGTWFWYYVTAVWIALFYLLYLR